MYVCVCVYTTLYHIILYYVIFLVVALRLMICILPESTSDLY